MTQAQTMKIGVLGLENAGKTSLIQTLQRTYHIGKSLSPTKNVERSFFSLFGQQGSVWDFGGQAIYREIYLKNPNRFLTGIRYLFYVIDIQDTDRYPESLQYFKRIYEYASSQNVQLITSILFHKVDPELREDKKTVAKIDSLKREIQRISEDIEIGFYDTTSYDPFSVLNAFSRPILGDLPLYNSLSVLFANFSIDKSIEYMSLLVDDLLELGSFRLKTENQEFLNASLKYYKNFFSLEMDTNIRSYLFEGYRFTVVRRELDKVKYTLNLAHPIISENPIPTEEQIMELLPQIDQFFDDFAVDFL